MSADVPYQTRTLPGSLRSPALPQGEGGRAGEGGFTLIEVIVALAILGLSLTVLFAIFSQSIARIRVNETRESERLLAQSLLQRTMLSDPIPADSAGRTDGFLWHVHIAPFGSEDDAHNWPQSAHEVTVTVAREGHPGDHVTLSTLRLGPKERVE